MLTRFLCSASIAGGSSKKTIVGFCNIVKSLAVTLLICSLLVASIAHANDFPTQARVEYVLRCMDSHGGQTYQTLYSCICTVDKIAESIAYDEYVEADVFTQLRSTPGERGGMFRDPDRASLLVKKISDVTEMAEKSCFVGLRTDTANMEKEHG